MTNSITTPPFISQLQDRAILSITALPTSNENNNEPFDFLQGITSNEMADVTNEHCGFGTLLTPQGKILFDFFIIKIDNGYLLDCDKEHSAALFKKLRLYKLRAKIDLADISDEMSVGVFVQNNKIDIKGENIYPDPRSEMLGVRIYASKEDLPSLLKSIHDAPISPETKYYNHCGALGVPALAHGFASEQVFLLDVNYDLLNAVSYKKGCFVGQEVTSRMKRKGEVRKRTLCLSTENKAILPIEENLIGENIIRDDNKIGSVLSHFETHALALIRMDRVDATSPSPITLKGITVNLFEPAYFPLDQEAKHQP